MLSVACQELATPPAPSPDLKPHPAQRGEIAEREGASEASGWAGGGVGPEVPEGGSEAGEGPWASQWKDLPAGSSGKPAEPLRSAMSFRRIAVSLAAGSRPVPSTRRPQREQVPTVPLPRYSRIIFRAGSVSVR